MAPKRPVARITPPTEDALTPIQRETLDRIRAARGHPVSLKGPFAVWIHTPQLAYATQNLSLQVHLDMTAPKRLREFVILVTAQHWKAQFVWASHEATAKANGVLPETIEDLRWGRTLTRAAADERAIQTLLAELHTTRRVSDATFANTCADIRTEWVIELIAVAGYAALVSMTLDTFQIMPESDLPFEEP